MKSGRPKADPSKAPRRARPRSQKPDQFGDPDPNGVAVPAANAAQGVTPPIRKTRTRSNQQPRQKTKRGFAGLLLDDPRLDDNDRAAIRGAAENPLTPADLAVLVCYEIRLARKFYDSGDLAAKDLVVALTKLSSQAAAVAQLSQSAGGSAVGKLEITFASPDGGQDVASPQGDIIDVEG